MILCSFFNILLITRVSQGGGRREGRGYRVSNRSRI